MRRCWKIPSPYTCLESIAAARIDLDGERLLSPPLRVELAVSDGKEVYGPADGVGFSAKGLRQLLEYGFGTTGLISSIARAVIAANEFAIDLAGEFTSGGETILRYNFSALPSTAGWKIS